MGCNFKKHFTFEYDAVGVYNVISARNYFVGDKTTIILISSADYWVGASRKDSSKINLKTGDFSPTLLSDGKLSASTFSIRVYD